MIFRPITLTAVAVRMVATLRSPKRRNHLVLIEDVRKIKGVI